MGAIGFEVLLKARGHLRIREHRPGRIRLRYDAGILGALPELKSREGRDALAALDGIEDIDVSLLGFTLTVAYDPAKIPPESWDKLVEGSEAEARAVVDSLRRAAGA